MAAPRRVPIAPPRAFAAALERASKERRSLQVDGVSILPPTGKRLTWRLVVYVNKQRLERSGGRTPESVYAAFSALVAERSSLESARSGRPEHERVLLAQVIGLYLQQGGRSGKWKDKTKRQRLGDFRVLKAIAESEHLCCMDLGSPHLRRALHETVATDSRAETVKRAYGAFLKWGWQSGYFSGEQAVLYAQIRWNPPADYVRPRTRKQRAAEAARGQPGRAGRSPPARRLRRSPARPSSATGLVRPSSSHRPIWVPALMN